MQDPTGMVWEEIGCPLCGHGDEELLLAVAGEPDQTLYRLVRCQRCGMGYVNPRPAPASIAQFYPEDYKPYQPRCDGNAWWDPLTRYLEQLVLSRFHGYPPKLTRWSEKLTAHLAAPFFGPRADSLTALPYVGEGRLLDFGCGSGYLAYRLWQRGWDVLGMDISEHALRQTHEQFGLPTLAGTLPHPQVPPQSLDAVVMGGVLEHIHWPHPLIAEASRVLRPGGLLAVSVPNLASWGFRTFGMSWFPLDLPRHLLHFTPATLRLLLEANGLDILELRLLGRTSWMRQSMRNLRRQRPRGRLLARLARFGRLRFISGLVTRWTVWMRQADCQMVLARRKAA